MVNKVILVGNVGVDPEVRTLESGVKTARVRLATSERFYNRDTKETTDHTEWHTITLWRNLADVVDRFVRKGSQLYIEGRLRTREWTDQSGNKRYSTEILASDMKLLGRRQDGAQGAAAPQGYVAQPQGGYSAPAQQPYAQPAPQPAAAPIAAPAADPDDLPF
jgi:single-strand DNA-binding protein